MKFRLDQSRTGQLVLAPFDEAAVKFLDAQIEDARITGEPFEIEVLHPRDMVEHRRIMAQIGEVARALHRSPESVRAELLYCTGNFAMVGELSGLPPAIAVNSMSRQSMTDRELHAFWEEAREAIISRLLPRVEDADERERLLMMLSPQPA